MEKTVQQIIQEYLDLLRRGKYFIIVPVVIAAILGSAVAYKLPEIYRSNVKLLYVQNRAPAFEELQTVQIYLEAAIMFVEFMALSHSNCLKMITELNLYPELAAKQVPQAEIIKHMKDNYKNKLVYTSVQGTAGRTEEVVTGIKFSFDHGDPEKAYDVANQLATNFVVYYREFRESFAMDSSSFFEDERQRLKQEINRLDKKISDFKEKNVNELPELFQSNYRMIDLLSQRLFDVDQEIQQMQLQKRNLETNLATINPLISMAGISGQQILTPEEKLAALKAELGILLSTFSEKHPDVIRARHEIAMLEKTVAERRQKRESTKSGDGKTGYFSSLMEDGDLDGAYNPAYIQLLTQLEDLKVEIESLKKEKKKVENELFEYETRVGRTPLVEKDYQAMERDRQNAQRRYNELSDQVLKLESAAALEKREMGGGLKLHQPPSYPLSPVKPNRPFIILGSIFASMVFGVAMLLGWEYLTQTVRTPQDFENISTLPVLVEIPLIGVKPNKKMLRMQKYAIRIGCIVLIAGVVFLVDAFYMDVDVLIAKIIITVRKKLVLMGL